MKDQAGTTAANTNTGDSTQKPQAPVGLGYILLLTTFTLGTSSVYSCNQQVLQLTAWQFVKDIPSWLPATVFIGLILSIQELGQILATPYAAWKSDRIWTRFGRRKPLVMVVAPILAIAIFLVPRCPSLGLFLIVVFVLQLAEGAELSVMMPSISDSIPDKLRPMAIAMTQMAMALSGFLMGKYVMRVWMKPGEHSVSLPFIDKLGVESPSFTLQGAHHWPYTVAAVVVIVTSLVYLKVMREKYVPPRPKEKFRLFTYSKEVFQFREHQLIWLVFLFQPLFMVVATEYLPTLGTQGMGLDAPDYGDAYSWRGAVQFVLAIPLGYLFSRLKCRKAVCIAACAYAMLPATFALFFMNTKTDLAIFFAMHVITFLVFRMNFYPLVMEYTTPRNVGTILGFSSAVTGIVRIVLIPILGYFIHVFDNYRLPLYATYVGSIVCIVALAMMRSPEEVRHLVEAKEPALDTQTSPAEA